MLAALEAMITAQWKALISDFSVLYRWRRLPCIRPIQRGPSVYTLWKWRLAQSDYKFTVGGSGGFFAGGIHRFVLYPCWPTESIGLIIIKTKTGIVMIVGFWLCFSLEQISATSTARVQVPIPFASTR